MAHTPEQKQTALPDGISAAVRELTHRARYIFFFFATTCVTTQRKVVCTPNLPHDAT